MRGVIRTSRATQNARKAQKNGDHLRWARFVLSKWRQDSDVCSSGSSVAVWFPVKAAVSNSAGASYANPTDIAAVERKVPEAFGRG
jgi:hypothetical protein